LSSFFATSSSGVNRFGFRPFSPSCRMPHMTPVTPRGPSCYHTGTSNTVCLQTTPRRERRLYATDRFVGKHGLGDRRHR
jgi:hypothetical protein